MLTRRKYSLTFIPPRATSTTHGWIVVLGVSLVFIFNTSLTTIFPIIYDPILQSPSNLNLATIIFTILSNVTILATGFLIKDLSAKHFVIIGSSILFVGLVCSAFITSLSQLILTYSILCAIGIGLLNPACFVAVFTCFSASRNHAIGVTFAALGLGQLIMPLIADSIMKSTDYRVGIGIMSLISVIGLIGANLLTPIKWRNCNEQCCVLICQDEEQEPLLSGHCSSTCPVKNFKDENHSVMKDVVKASDLDLLMDYNYLVISIGLAFVYAVSIDFSNILPELLTTKMNMDIDSSIQCIYVISFVDILTRALYPFILTGLSSIQIFLIGVAGLSVAKILLLYLSFHISMIFFICALIGLFKALTIVTQVLIIDDFCHDYCPRKLPGMLGISFVIKSIFLCIIGQILNSLASTMIDVTIHIYSHLILQFFVFIIWFIVLR